MVLLLAGCDKSYEFTYDIIVTDQATNLGRLNSRYDDYNSDLPYPGNRMEIYFSSNRNSLGKHFDIVAGIMDFSYHSKDDILDITIPTNSAPGSESDFIFQKINTGGNEFGPYTYNSGKDLLFMYASGFDGDFGIKFLEYTNWNYSGLNQEISEPTEVAQINDIGANLYPSISADKTKLYFCSNRTDTAFSIYTAHYNSEITKESLITGDIDKIEKSTVLSSLYNDKCPYVQDNILVFTSDRPGGFGGYDLWYSRYENNAWSAPTNFGDKVNSEYDEFRPVLFENLGHKLMIFSSDRPEGKGGFDLYMVRTGDFKK